MECSLKMSSVCSGIDMTYLLRVMTMSRAICLKLMTILILTGILTTASTLRATDELKLVEEDVDEMCVIQPASANYRRILFFRDGKFLADRIWQDDMLLLPSGGGFVLIWQDHLTAHRVVAIKKYSVWTTDRDDTVDETVLWWAQARRCTDLKQPD